MADFDVVVVGARCAGSSLGAHLARRGLSVCVVDRAKFPSEVPSTHMIHPNGVKRLWDLGLKDPLAATGAPALRRGFFAADDARLELSPQIVDRFDAPWLCVRRVVLDTLLLDAARTAGAEVRTQTKVTGLLEDHGRVSGVRTEGGPISARLVVGADGPHSSVARLVGATEYQASDPGRFFLWAYFDGANHGEGEVTLGRIDDIAFLSMPTDAGLHMTGVALPMHHLGGEQTDPTARFDKTIARLDHLRPVLEGARRDGPVRALTRWHGYFRQSAGPGWALVGDAGHFKDPTPAQGISDALRQSDRLAQAIATGLGDTDLDTEIGRWWQWRDEDAWEMYWLATDMGSPGPQPLATEMIRHLADQPDGTEQFLRVLDRRQRPSKLFTASRALRATARSITRQPFAIAALAQNLSRIGHDALTREVARRRRQRQNRYPYQSRG